MSGEPTAETGEVDGREASPAGTVSAVVLAAGASRRFGAPKLLADVGGEPLVRRTVAAVRAAAVSEVIVVLGAEADAVRRALAGLDVRCVVNAHHARGMSTSLHEGIRAVAPAVDAVLIALADQPLPASVIDRVVEAFRATSAAIVIPVYAGSRGNPVLFRRDLFRELLTVTGDRGAREVVAAEPGRVREVSFPYPAPIDVDTRDDLRRVLDAIGLP